MYGRDFFADERTNVSISQTAANIPVDEIESPYRIKIEEDRSSLKGIYNN